MFACCHLCCDVPIILTRVVMPLSSCDVLIIATCVVMPPSLSLLLSPVLWCQSCHQSCSSLSDALLIFTVIVQTMSFSLVVMSVLSLSYSQALWCHCHWWCPSLPLVLRFSCHCHSCLFAEIHTCGAALWLLSLSPVMWYLHQCDSCWMSWLHPLWWIL
jgi:hypothetical protein